MSASTSAASASAGRDSEVIATASETTTSPRSTIRETIETATDHCQGHPRSADTPSFACLCRSEESSPGYLWPAPYEPLAEGDTYDPAGRHCPANWLSAHQTE